MAAGSGRAGAARRSTGFEVDDVLEGFVTYFAERSWWQLALDGLDVTLVFVAVYQLLRWVKGTRAAQVGTGFVVLMLVYAGAQLFRLTTLSTLLSSVFQSVVLVFVVVFQQDIRRMLTRVGASRGWLPSRGRNKESKALDEIVEAVSILARHRIGALIAFELEAELDDFVGANKGHVVGAAISSELLVTIFLPESLNQLHDGAVIVKDYRIAKAGVFFPMPEGRSLDQSYGSRHRAAVGITEETDAVVVAVSEERGTVSFCFAGNIVSNVDAGTLRETLAYHLSPNSSKRRKSPLAGKTTKKREDLAPAERAPSRRATDRPADKLERASDAVTTPIRVERDPSTGEVRVSRPGEAATPVLSLRAKAPEVAEAPTPLRPRPAPEPEVAAPVSVRAPLKAEPLGSTPIVGRDEPPKAEEDAQ